MRLAESTLNRLGTRVTKNNGYSKGDTLGGSCATYEGSDWLGLPCTLELARMVKLATTTTTAAVAVNRDDDRSDPAQPFLFCSDFGCI